MLYFDDFYQVQHELPVVNLHDKKKSLSVPIQHTTAVDDVSILFLEYKQDVL
jgi:hypothetical protein